MQDDFRMKRDREGSGADEGDDDSGTGKRENGFNTDEKEGGSADSTSKKLTKDDVVLGKVLAKISSQRNHCSQWKKTCQQKKKRLAEDEESMEEKNCRQKKKGGGRKRRRITRNGQGKRNCQD